uniref:Putative secreted protein n=1 Tax=Ornithodoros turicata TaxID=34597 RepID=A0A2R5L6F8_9ACAR
MKALVVILLLALATELFNPVSAAKKNSRPKIKSCQKIPCTNKSMCNPSCAGCYADPMGSRGIKYCQAG